jgi:hypothetical protein
MLTLVCKLELAECVVNFGARYEEVMVRPPDLCTPLSFPRCNSQSAPFGRVITVDVDRRALMDRSRRAKPVRVAS